MSRVTPGGETTPEDRDFIEKKYREGVRAAEREDDEPCPYEASSLAGHWWARGFQWMSANLDRQRLTRERDEALASRDEVAAFGLYQDTMKRATAAEARLERAEAAVTQMQWADAAISSMLDATSPTKGEGEGFDVTKRIAELQGRFVVAEAEREALRVQLSEALEELVDTLNQACAGDDGRVDSMALSAYRDGLTLLARHGLFEIEHQAGRRVVGKFTAPPAESRTPEKKCWQPGCTTAPTHEFCYAGEPWTAHCQKHAPPPYHHLCGKRELRPEAESRTTTKETT